MTDKFLKGLIIAAVVFAVAIAAHSCITRTDQTVERLQNGSTSCPLFQN